MECKETTNTQRCTCTYDHCSRKGICCECIAYHWRNNELPGCLFSAAAERTYDRSIRKFIRDQS